MPGSHKINRIRRSFFYDRFGTKKFKRVRKDCSGEQHLCFESNDAVLRLSKLSNCEKLLTKSNFITRFCVVLVPFHSLMRVASKEKFFVSKKERDLLPLSTPGGFMCRFCINHTRLMHATSWPRMIRVPLHAETECY